MQKEISRKIIRNTGFNIAGHFWSILVALFLTPFIIRHIGVERYGIWAIIGVLTGYFGLLDFGVGSSFVKHIAEFYAKKDYLKINRIINTGIVFYSVFALIVIPFSFLIVKPLIPFFKIPAHLSGEAFFVFLLGIILFCVSNIVSPFVAIQNGLQRMGISNKVAIAVSIPNVLGTIFFLKTGYGLPGLMVNNAFILVISSVTNIIIAFKILPGLKINPLLFSSKKMFKKLFGFGYKLQVSTIASLFHSQADKIILGYFLNVGMVTYYTVAATIATKVRAIPLLLVSAIMPAASELETKTDKQALSVLYFRSMKYIMLILLPLSLMVILLADPFINLWLGANFEKAVLTLQLLMFGYFFNIITGPGFHILNGMGKPHYGMRSSILAAALNLFLSILLVIKIGYWGVVAGTAFSMIAGAVYFICMAHSAMDIPISATIKNTLLKPLLSCIAPFAIIYFWVNQVENITWAVLVGAGALYLIIYGLFILKVDYLDEFDKNMVNRYLPIKIFKRPYNGNR